MGFLSQLLAYARGQGFKVDRDIDLSLLRGKITERGRDKTHSISRADLEAIFGLACFTGSVGCAGKEAFIPGPHIYHRALYFAIILLYYTGARREEICGLMVDDIRVFPASADQAELPYIDIVRNQERRIKNSQSTRFIALHPEVVRLGFLQYVEAIRALGYDLVFPDLKSPTTSSPMGDRLYDEFSPGFRQAIPDASARQKVLRSFRKTFGSSLKKAQVPSESRGDILGHGGETITEEIYADAIALSLMLEEIVKLPNVTEHLELRPIQLLPWVDAKIPASFSRKARRRPLRA